jgi:SAM-dependent methyltransferase
VHVCESCRRWFPILDSLPELLPDHLRDAARDASLLASLATAVPADVRRTLRDAASTDTARQDHGAHHKRAEIGIAQKVEDPKDFFGPGQSSPFNPGNTTFTFYLINLFANVITLLDVTSTKSLVIDSGCGYAWTTEWLAKSGVDAIGVDICREYLAIGVRRMGASRPHLLVADVEQLPIADHCARAVLAFESFHHVPDRARALAGYARALQDGGAVVLAEPGATHDAATVSVDMMAKYGILEKGMELEDVEGYIAGLPFRPPEYHFVLHASAADLDRGLFLRDAGRHAVFHGHLFRLRKDAAVVAPTPAPGAPRVHAEAGPVSTASSELAAMQREHERFTREKDSRLAQAAMDLQKLSVDLAVANADIRAMRSSLFWKARDAWIRVARVLFFRRP